MAKGTLHLRGPFFRYGLAVAVAIASTSLRYAMMPLLGTEYVYIFVYPAIIIIAILAGPGPAILNSIIASLMAEYYFTPGLQLSDLPIICIVIFTAFLAGWLADRLHKALAESRKKANDLAESEEKFRTLAENTPAIIGIVQGQRIVYANPYSEQATGYTIAELLNLDFPKLVHPDYQQEMMERAARRQAGQAVESHYEFIMITKSGRQRWLDFSPAMITYRGKPAIVGIAYDITDRKQAESALRESEEKFRMLAENAGAIIGIMQDLKIMYANPYSQRASGYSLEELLNIDVKKLIHPDYQQIMMQRAERRQRGEPIESHYEFVMLTKSGESRWLDFSPIMITYHGRPAIVGIAFDITERKRAEEALIRFKEQLEKKNTELQTIIGIVSHDLRAPLVNVKGFAKEIAGDVSILRETLQKAPSGRNTLNQLAPIFDRFTQSVHFISSSAEAMDNLAKSLVNVARAGLSAINPEVIDMNELIAKVIASIEMKLRRSGASINIENLPPCYADKAQVTQIFANLLDNAVKYLDPQRPGLINISGKIEDKMVSYCVIDNGIGIAADDQQKIFNPYYQLHEKPSEGVGMGLTTVQRMVERNSGRIWLSSEKNKGSAFCILLPKQP